MEMVLGLFPTSDGVNSAILIRLGLPILKCMMLKCGCPMKWAYQCPVNGCPIMVKNQGFYENCRFEEAREWEISKIVLLL